MKSAKTLNYYFFKIPLPHLSAASVELFIEYLFLGNTHIKRPTNHRRLQAYRKGRGALAPFTDYIN